MSKNNRSSFWVVSAPDLNTALVYVEASPNLDKAVSVETATLDARSIENEPDNLGPVISGLNISGPDNSGVNKNNSGPNNTVLEMTFYDCDGDQANQAKIEFSTKRQCLFELEPLLGGLKRQAGFAHGLVTLSGRSDISRLLLRYQSSHASWLIPSHKVISRSKPHALAVHLSESRRGLLVLANTENTEVTVRGRLLVGKRSPECAWTLPGRSSRIVDLVGTFADVIGEDPSSMFGRGYLRLSTSSEGGVITHLMLLSGAEDGSESIQIF